MDRGDRVIVGGAEVLHRSAIVRRFVELAGGPAVHFAILASATSQPDKEFAKFCSWLGEAGVAAGQVELLRVSFHLPGAERGAWDAAEVARLEAAQGLWLLGGDQNKTLGLLRGDKGEDSPLLAALRRRAMLPAAEGGLVVGGTSAGAAVMSDPMIGGGTSFGALALSHAAAPGRAEMSRALYVQKGLGLFAEGMLDQHFDTRARLGRLLEAALVEDGARRLAFGIDEATALVREGAAGRLSVVGAGGVTVIDPRGARRDLVDMRDGPRTRIRDVVLHHFTAGDSFDAELTQPDFGGKEAIEAGDEAFASERPEASGVLSPYGSLAAFAARMLLDNDPSLLFREAGTGRGYVRSLLVEEGTVTDGAVTVSTAGTSVGPLAWEVRLFRDAGGSRSLLWYDGHFSFTGVGLDIIPIEIDISRPF